MKEATKKALLSILEVIAIGITAYLMLRLVGIW